MGSCTFLLPSIAREAGSLSAMFAKSIAISALAAVAAAAPLSVLEPVSLVSAAVNPTNETHNSTVYWYRQEGRAGACGEKYEDSDKVVGLPYEFYSKFDSVSPYCGNWVEVTNPKNNVTVAAKVADASTLNDTLVVSVATWKALKGEDNLATSYVLWNFANSTASDEAQASASVSTADTIAWDGSEKQTGSAASATDTPDATDSQHEAPASATTAWSSSETSKPEPSSSSSSSSSSKKSSSSSKAATTSAKKTSSSSSSKQAEATQAAYDSGSSSSSSSSTSSSSSGRSGTATYFYQGGNPGNCGQYHSDSDYLVALQTSTYAGGSHCGQYITVSYGGKSIKALVADSCPSCGSSSDIDLSVAAFQALGSLSQGVLSVKWSF